ncbi:MAG: cobalamin B12-binding domain-containing protein [Thermoanaerobaculia bacterium]
MELTVATTKARVFASSAGGADLADLSGPFLMALLGGDEAEAEELLRCGRARGADTALLVRDLVVPALAEVGRMWERGEVSVAEEHLATALATRVVARSAGAAALPGGPGRPRILLACLAGEFHDVGIRLLSDVARESGWDAESLGANVPRESLVRFVAQRRPSALALSVSLAGHVPEAARTIADARAAAPEMTILVGGRAVCEDVDRVPLTGADAAFCDAVAFRDWLRARAGKVKGTRTASTGARAATGLPAEMPAALRKRCSRPR